MMLKVVVFALRLSPCRNLPAIVDRNGCRDVKPIREICSIFGRPVSGTLQTTKRFETEEKGANNNNVNFLPQL